MNRISCCLLGAQRGIQGGVVYEGVFRLNLASSKRFAEGALSQQHSQVSESSAVWTMYDHDFLAALEGCSKFLP